MERFTDIPLFAGECLNTVWGRSLSSALDRCELTDGLPVARARGQLAPLHTLAQQVFTLLTSRLRLRRQISPNRLASIVALHRHTTRSSPGHSTFA
jgi:hypothetical protein